MTPMAHPRAGQPAQPEDLIDVDAVVSAYYDLVPDPDDPDQQVVLRHLRASRVQPGHRVQRRAHRRDHPGDRGVPRVARASPGRSTSARTPTRCRCRPGRRRSRCCVANGVTVLAEDDEDYTPTPAVSRAIVVHNACGRAGRKSPTASWSPRRTTRHGTAASSTTRRTAARPTPTPPAGSPPGPTPCSPTRPRSGAPRTPRSRRTCTASTTSGAYCEDLVNALNLHAVRDAGRAHRRRPDGRRQRAVLGLHRRAPRHRPHRGQPQGRPAVGVHDPGHRRQDPDGLLLAQRDGQPDHATRTPTTSPPATTPTPTGTASSPRTPG